MDQHLVSGSGAEQADPAQHVVAMRSLFGSPRPAIAAVLQGSSVEQVLTNPKIAIVDDEPINVKVVQKYLKLAGYQRFVTTTDATEALGLITTEYPDVVLLDVMMPHVSGLEILGQLRSQEAFVDLPVVILTAATDRETKLQALCLGATEFLGKPVDAAELEIRLRNMLRLKAHQDRIKSYAWELELEVAIRSTELAQAHTEVVQCLAKVGEYRDNETGKHVLRVGRCAEIIALELGLGEELAGRLRHAAALHDIGKVAVPDSILLKPGRLDEAEMAVMRGHCECGRNICSPGSWPLPEAAGPGSRVAPVVASTGISPIMRMAAIVAYTHHEKWDGTGYPQGLSGDQIPIEGRITALVDVLDALLSCRPYKQAMTWEEAIQIIRENRGRHFDPAVVDAFLKCQDRIRQVYVEYADQPTAWTETGPVHLEVGLPVGASLPNPA